MSIRLNANDRERLSAKLCVLSENRYKATFDAELEKLTQHLEESIARFYGDDLAVLKKWDCLTAVDGIEFKACSGWWERIKLPRKIYLPHTRIKSGLEVATFADNGAAPRAFEPMFDAFEQYHAEAKRIGNAINAMLASCRTEDQLLKLWPEAAPVVKEVLGQKPTVVKVGTDDAAREALIASLPKLNIPLLPAPAPESTSPDE